MKKNIRKRLVTLIAVAVLTFCLLPLGANAEGDVASLTVDGSTTYYPTADAAFQAALSAGRGTVTILSNATYTQEVSLYSSSEIHLVVNSGATLTLEEMMRIDGSISGGGTIAETNTGGLVTYGNATVENVTVAGEMSNYGTIRSGTFTGMVQNGEMIAGGTFNAEVYNSGTINGGTFQQTVYNHHRNVIGSGGTIQDGVFNGNVNNLCGTVNGGTFHATLENVSQYGKKGTVNADGLIPGEKFVFVNEGNDVNCNDHQRRLDATCQEGKKCIFCGNIEGEADPTAHAWSSWAYAAGSHSRTCAHGDHPESGKCVPGTDGECTTCKTALTASVTQGTDITYYATADEAFSAANTAGSGTVIILADTTTTQEWELDQISLEVRTGATLNLGNAFTVRGTISGGGTIGGTLNNKSIISGCTFTGTVNNLEVGTIKGGVFDGTVNNQMGVSGMPALIEGGTFNGAVNNIGSTINGGTFNGALAHKQSRGMGNNSAYGTINFDNLTLGDGFSLTDESGVYQNIICNTHKHAQFHTPATCVAPMNCLFSGSKVGEADLDAHKLTYSAQGSELTETCANGCTHKATAAISGSSSNLTYTGKEIKPFTVSYTDDQWLGGTPEIVYQNNVNAGYADAVIQVNEAKAKRTFEIRKATPKAEHFVFTAPTGLTYDGTEKTAKVEPVSSVTGMGEITVIYYRDGVKLENESPAAAGTYTVSIKVKDGSNFKAPYENRSITDENWTYTVAQAQSIVAAPTGKKLTYSGNAQNLVNAGETNGNQPLYYALGINGVWSTDIPQATDAGTYTVYWYAGSDSGNYKRTSGEITVTIAPATITVTPDAKTVTYGDAIPELTYTSSGHIGTEIPAFEGELMVDSWEGGIHEIKQGTLRLVESPGFMAANYEMKLVPVNLTVKQAANRWIAEPNVTNWDYGMAPNIPTADPRFGTLITEYRLKSGTDADYTTEIPTFSGAYFVRFRVEETSNWTGLSQVEALNIDRTFLTITVEDQTIKLGGRIDQSKYKVTGLAAGDTAVITLTADTDRVTADGMIEAEYVIRNESGADVTDCYSVAVGFGKLVVEPDTSKIDQLTVENVTSADEEAVKKVQDMMKDSESIEEDWEDIDDKCDALLKRIEAAQAAVDTENTEKVENVTAENVKNEDKEALEAAKADLEKALKDNGGNYTEAEKKDIREALERMEAAVTALENVEAVTESIIALPESVEPDDEAAAEKITAAKAAYDALTDHEKSLVDETTKKKLDDLVTDLTAYDIVKGDGCKWTKGSDGRLSFTANGPFSKFVGIEMDGKEVDETYYQAKSGSTIITLKQSYLKKLSNGWHTITVVYTDGETSGTFKIQAESEVPETDDDSDLMLYGSMFTVSLAAIVVLLSAAKKRKRENT